MRGSLRRWAAVALGAGLIGSSVAGVPGTAADAAQRSGKTPATTAVKVDPRRTFQTIQGWGTSLAWWAETTGGWRSAREKERLAAALFSKDHGLGLNIVRYDIGATGWGDLCAGVPFRERTGAAVPSFEVAPGLWDWKRDPNQVWMLRQAEKDGANRFEAIAYSAPSWMTLDDCSAGAMADRADNLNPLFYTAYARYLATVVKHAHDDWGITFRTVDPFNEPVQTVWNPTRQLRGQPIQQGMNVGYRAQNAILPRLKESLARNGASAYTAISAPDEQSVDGAVQDYQNYDAAGQAAVAQLNAHDYQDTQNGDHLYELGRRTGKPVWMSEWGGNGSVADSMGSAVVLAQHIDTNERQLHPAAWSIWQAADGGTRPDEDGTCDDLWGLVCTNIEPNAPSPHTLTFPKRYYAMGNYSEFVHPGYRMVAGSDPDTFAAYDEHGGTLVIVATNDARSPKPVTYDLSGFAAAGGTAVPHRTDLTSNLDTEPAIPVTGGRFSDTLPRRSVTTYVVKAAPGGGGSPFGRLAPVQYGQDMYVFGRAADHHVVVDHWGKGTGWSGWRDLGGNMSGNPVAAVFRNQVQVFAVGEDGHAHSDVLTQGKGWSGWQSLGGDLLGGLSAVPFGYQMQVVGVGVNGSAYQKVWDPATGWSPWHGLGGRLTSEASAVGFGGQLQVFGIGANGHAYQKVWDPKSGWSGWRDLRGRLTGDLSAVRFGGQLQVFGRAANGRAYQDVWDPKTGWSGWRDLGGSLVGDLSAVQLGQDLHVFGRATNGHAYVKRWQQGVGWSGWSAMGGHLSGDVTGIPFGIQVQAFAEGTNRHAYCDVLTPGSGWRGWRDLGGRFG